MNVYYTDTAKQQLKELERHFQKRILDLAEISQCVSVSAIALLILDGAGWHSSPQLIVPENIVLMPLPPYAPELNSVENIWGYLRSNFPSHSVWDTYEAILDAWCLERPDGRIQGHRLNWNQRLGTGQDLERLVGGDRRAE